MRLFFLLLWCICAKGISAQPGFNRSYSLGYNFNQFFDLVVHNDTIIAYGSGQDSLAGFQKGVLVARFDSSGNLIDDKLILDTTNNIYSIDKFWGKIIATKDGGYAMTTATLYGRDGVFIKLNQNLELEFVQRYHDTVNLGEFLVAPLELPDGYLLYGFFNRAGNMVLDALLRKVDKQGNPIWRKNFGVYDTYESFRQAAIWQDSLLAISGFKAIQITDPTTYTPWVCIFNRAGELKREWSTNSSAPYQGIALGWFFPHPDSSWLVYSSKYLGIHPEYGWPRYQPYWVKLNKNFQFQWAKPFGPNVNNLDRFSRIIRASNGDFIGFGERGPFNPDVEGLFRKGWVMRFSPEADSLWDWTGKSPITDPVEHYFSGGALLSSGSIVAAGAGYAPNGYPYCWLVKLSPDGCVDTLFCHPTSGLAPPQAGKTAWRFFPNPASERVTMLFPENSALKIRLLDISGRSVAAFEPPPGAGEFSFSVQNMPPGMYFLQMTQASGAIRTERVVVGR